MYGTDYPCWDPATALALLGEIDLSEADRQKLFHDNARRILNLHSAHRTGQAGLPHPALGQDLTPSPTARRAQGDRSTDTAATLGREPPLA
jgi:Amidohydrolase